MSEEKERGPQIVDAHQELVRHIEQGAGRIRALSIVTVAVAAILVVSYVSQLALPLAGTRTVTVNLADPGSIAAELVVLALALVWLYVGVQDLRFSWRMKAEIRSARSKEREIQDRIS
jgi:hypothetical protein